MKKPLTAQQTLEAVRGGLKHYSAAGPKIRYWMDTGDPLLHAVLGSRTKGLPYGKLYELFGNESQGKTVLALDLAAQAQQDGAEVAWVDFESSWDSDWAKLRGLDPDEVVLFEPYIGSFGGEAKERLITAEEMCEEFEKWVERRHRKNRKVKIFAAFDSVAAMLVDVEAQAGITDQDMRSNYGLPSFLSKLLRRWIAMARNNNVMLVFVNQVRTRPVRFGNPEQSVGGKALKFYCHIRAELRRQGGGVIKLNGKNLGMKGVIYNIKNKAGGGSEEKHRCGFKFFWDGRSKFFPAKDIKED